MKILLLSLLFFVTFLYSAPLETKKLDKVSLQLHWKYQFGQDIEQDVLSGKSEYGIYNSPRDLVGKKIMASTKEDFIFQEKRAVKDILFTEEEIQYIKDKKVINLCLNYKQFPVDGYENGKFIGILADVFSIISEKTQLKFNPIVSTSLHNLQQNLNNDTCDALDALATKNQTYKTLLPTKPFATTHFTLVSELDKSFVTYPEALEGKRLITQLTGFNDYLLHIYPYLTIDIIDTKEEMIKILHKKEAYAIITLDPQADYLIDEFGYGKLKINGFLAKEYPVEVSIGIQKDELLLHSIIQKALNKISPDTINSIVNSWRISRYEKPIDYSPYVYALIALFILLVIMAYIQNKLRSFNKKLELVVYNKTKELREINESLEIKVQNKVQELIKKDEILTVQSKQAVMGEMISMIAHQWRQPLNTITLQISNLQIKQMMGEKLEGKFLSDTLDEVTATIIYLSETVDDFKTYFHPDKEKHNIDINELITRAINFINPRLKSNKIEIVFQKSQKIELKIYTNEMIQVLLNIINNAIDAYDSIEFENKIIKIFVKEREEELTIFIQDNAGGIKKEIIKQLFEPYFTTKGKNGTGLGLYMSQMIVEKQFSGKLTLQSSNGETTFMITVPKSLND